VGEDDVPLEGDAAAEVTNAARRSGTRCEKCGRRANGSEVYCGQCGARIAL
jgi:uncharacterized OB-fold protein